MSEGAPGSVADAFVARLAAHGIGHIFGNAGTDFAPIIEALAKAEALGLPAPRPITVPFEANAVAMAHGCYLMTGRPQVAMVHVNVGTANALGNLIGAARQSAPLLLAAGRSPLTEQGPPGHRNRHIHWSQEVFDQAGMLREYVKWDYELRHGVPVADAIDRALAIAASEPMGPVYLTLPREVLAAPANGGGEAAGAVAVAATAPAPDPDALARIAGLLRDAERPLIITATAGTDPGAFDALAALAGDYAIAVVQHAAQVASLAADHPMNMGESPGTLLAAADLALVIDAPVPWIPALEAPAGDCVTVQIGPDPLFERYPIRGFVADIALQSTARLALDGLAEALAPERRAMAARIDRRRARIAAEQADRRAAAAGRAAELGPLSAFAVSQRIGEICGPEAVYVSEYNLALAALPIARPRSYFGVGPAGYLGWGLGAALGIKLAAPDRLVVAGVGDGAYMFNNPAACHFVGAAEGLPTLTVVFNNRRWNAVDMARRYMYPDGYAARSNRPPFVALEPSPDYEKIVAANGGHGERVDDPAELTGAIERALGAVTTKSGRQC